MKILEGKRGLIFGALDEKSIAWKVAQNAHEQGAKFVLSNAPIALRMGKINELSEKTGSGSKNLLCTWATRQKNLGTDHARICQKPVQRIGMYIHHRKLC